MLGLGLEKGTRSHLDWSVLILDAVTVKVFGSCARVSDCIDFNIAREKQPQNLIYYWDLSGC